MRDKQAGASGSPRPRLSPKSVNAASRPDYFVPPTPSIERPAPAWSFSGSHDKGSALIDENGRGPGPSSGSVAHDAVGETGGGPFSGGAANSSATGKTPPGEGWAASMTPSFALSPSSTAFNTKFTHLMRGPSSSDIPATPLHAPAASPFFPSEGQEKDTSAFSTSTHPLGSSANFATASSSAAPHPAPPTPGPSTTAGLSGSTTSPFSFPISLPAGRRVAGRPSSSAARSSAPSVPAVNSSRYTLYSPQSLLSVVFDSANADKTSSPAPLLLLDIRTHTAFLSERLAGAINICVPSTLLRRPAFGIDRVLESLPGPDQAVFEKWSTASAIVVIDTESTSLVEGGGVASLLAKFDKVGYTGKLGWVKGGWYAVRTQLRSLPVDQQQMILERGTSGTTASAPTTGTSTPFEPTLPRGPQTAGLDGASASSSSSMTPGVGSKKHGRPVLQVRDLPIAAFQLASTSAYMHESSGRGGEPRTQGLQSGLPTSRRGVDNRPTSPLTSEGEGSVSSLASQRPDMGKRRKSGNESGTLNAHGSTSTGLTLRALLNPKPDLGEADGDHRSTAVVGKRDQLRTSANPFFDNIRQNSESLSLEGSLAHLTPVELPSVPPALFPALPLYLRSLLSLSPMSRADRLARQFYELEVAERERLEGMFRYHAQHTALAADGADNQASIADGAADPDDDASRWAKFGISAGVELGHLNRFKNIFPYEHTRVHLQQHSPSATDYVNASHLFLRGSHKRFIASQGPLPTTFRDFWQMCEQEQVGVVIMLTNLLEAGREKCGRYWVSQHDGEWDVSVQGDAAHEQEERERLQTESASAAGAPGGGFFAAFQAEPEKTEPAVAKDSTVRRTIMVQRRRGRGGDPTSTTNPPPPPPPRKIRHIQYRAWPDFDIPAEPADVVSLVDEVDAAQRDYMREIGWNPADHDGLEPPILAHCSAGVGRTGVFIMVSSLLAKMRRDWTGQHGQRGQREGSSSPGGGGAEPMQIDQTGPSASSPSMSTPRAGSGAATPARPPLLGRPSDPETSQLSAGLSSSSLDGRPAAPVAPQHGAAIPSLAARAAAPHPTVPPLDVPALEQDDPVFAGVNELREQRMSLVANARQFRSVYECLLEGALRLLQHDPDGTTRPLN